MDADYESFNLQNQQNIRIIIYISSSLFWVIIAYSFISVMFFCYTTYSTKALQNAVLCAGK